jgi:hypothetical protein
MAPYARTDAERRSVSVKGLERTFRNNAAAYRTLILNEPVIADEALLYRRAPGGVYQGGIQPMATTLPVDSAVHIFEPKRYGNKQNRMFGTGYFGFLTIQRHVGRNNAYSIVQPYVALPGEFLEIARKADGRALIDEFARLSSLINHDWFHSIMIGSINGDLSKPSRKAPAIQYLKQDYYANLLINQDGPGERRVADIPVSRTLRTMDKLWPKGSDVFWASEHDPYEEWPMRLQREVLSTMAEKPGNVLAQSVDRFRVALDRFASATAGHGVMKTIKLTPAAYAMKLLAFNLVRAVPIDHPVVTQILDGASEETQAIFRKMYDSKMAKKTLFGKGIGHALERGDRDSCATVEEYGAVVLDASAQSIGIAARDAREAFHYARMKPAEFHRVMDVHKAGAIAPKSAPSIV